MAVINVEHELDVTAKFDCLMQHSVSGESIYIRTKETLDAIFKEYSINSADKGQIIANVLGGMPSSITSAAMSTALAKSESTLQFELKSPD